MQKQGTCQSVGPVGPFNIDDRFGSVMEVLVVCRLRFTNVNAREAGPFKHANLLSKSQGMSPSVYKVMILVNARRHVAESGQHKAAKEPSVKSAESCLEIRQATPMQDSRKKNKI